MSSDSDLLAFQNSVEDNLQSAETVLFNQKKWNYITDSTSNSGSFGSGQIQFDLSSFASQSQWLNLSEAVIEFPVKVIAKVATAGNTTIGAINAVVIKNGWHQWIDSAQLQINGQTIQSAQPFENVAAQWRILSSWSQDELVKQGPTCGFALDDMTADSDVATNLAVAVGLSNAPSTVATGPRGFDAINNQTVLFNKGIQDRAAFTNTNINPTSASLQTTILGAANIKAAGRSHVAAQTTTDIDTIALSAFYMATVRLKDICDVKDFPAVKNLKGYLYLSFNSSKVNYAQAGGVSIQPISGRTTPFMLNTTSTGLTYGGAGPVTSIIGTIDGTSIDTVPGSGAAPLLTNARMLMPYYVANPKADAMLSQSNKFFTTMEKIQFTFDVDANGNAAPTITSGVPNPRRIVILPTWKGLGGNTTITNPEQSPFDTVPATSGPFAGLSQLQVYVANSPIYQYPVTYDYEQFLIEQATVGLNGNQSNEETSGLLTEQLWTQNHRFYTVDLSRRMDAEDGSSKSVSLSFNNPSSTFKMHVIGHLYYEKRWVIDTSTCQISPL